LCIVNRYDVDFGNSDQDDETKDNKITIKSSNESNEFKRYKSKIIDLGTSNEEKQESNEDDKSDENTIESTNK